MGQPKRGKGTHFFLEHHFFSFSCSIVSTTNDFAELFALKLILQLYELLHINELYIYGDYMNVIN